MRASSYTILTEDKNRAKVIRILDKYLDGYNLVSSYGSWKGKSERSLKIEVIVFDGSIAPDFEVICEEIKQANNQEAVLMVETRIKANLI